MNSIDTAETTDVVGFWRLAPSRRDHVAVIDPDGHQTTTGEIFDQVNQVSHYFRRRGLIAGDAIAVVARNRATTYVAYLAAMQSGLYYVPINYHSTAPEIEYILSDSQAALVICHPDFAEATQAAADGAGLDADRRLCLGQADGFLDLFAVSADESIELPADRPGGQVMQYTSGTTGRPKGIRRPLNGADADTAADGQRWLMDAFEMQATHTGVMLVQSPIYHSSNLALSVLGLHYGMSLVMMDKWTPEGMLELVERYGVTSTHMVPTQFVRLLQLSDEQRNAHDLSSLVYVIHGAAPCPIDVKRKMMEWWGPVIYEYYGSSEVGTTLATPTQWLERPGTVGLPMAISKLKILDEDGVEVPPGTEGRVFMRQGNDRFEYHNDPGKTDAARVDDLLTVGDLGHVDEDGYLFLTGRASELIISGGVNIYPAEIENAILLHPAVKDVAVIGAPEPEFGEKVVAVVVTDGTVDPAELADSLLAFARTQLAGFKCPRQVDFIDELPRDPNGKLYRRKLRDTYWPADD